MGNIEGSVDSCSEDWRLKRLDSLEVIMLCSFLEFKSVCSNRGQQGEYSRLLFVTVSLDLLSSSR